MLLDLGKGAVVVDEFAALAVGAVVLVVEVLAFLGLVIRIKEDPPLELPSAMRKLALASITTAPSLRPLITHLRFVVHEFLMQIPRSITAVRETTAADAATAAPLVQTVVNAWVFCSGSLRTARKITERSTMTSLHWTKRGPGRSVMHENGLLWQAMGLSREGLGLGLSLLEHHSGCYG